MPDDILDAAQKKINDAAKDAPNTDTGNTASSMLPEEPAPEPVVPAPPATPPEPPNVEPSPQQTPTTTPDATNVMESILNADTSGKVVPPAPTEPTPPPVSPPPAVSPKKSHGKGILLALLALLLLTLPVGVYFISQQNENVADIRNRAAWDTVYQGCTVSNGVDSCKASHGKDYSCHCQNGQICTNRVCEISIEANCRNWGRAYCLNSERYDAWTCCVEGYVCGSNNRGCVPGTKPTNPPRSPSPPPQRTPTPTTPRTPTSTPTTPPGGACIDIKIYRNGNVVTPTNLRASDNVTLAVNGSGTPTKAHFRVNGAQLRTPDGDSDPNWTESTTKNSAGEFTVTYTIPNGVRDFVIEGEVFINGAWK